VDLEAVLRLHRQGTGMMKALPPLHRAHPLEEAQSVLPVTLDREEGMVVWGPPEVGEEIVLDFPEEADLAT